MKLSEEEKRELLEDGRSIVRRDAFRKIKAGKYKSSRSLDDFINYLMGIQKIFGEFPLTRKITNARGSKL